MAEKCVSCRRERTDFDCELCTERTCKECEHFLAEGTFSFMSTVPEVLTKSRYCRLCYDREVVPALEKYEETMELARNAYFCFKTQARPVPILRRAPRSVKVENCPDRDETILRLGFLAVELGYNGILEGEVNFEKVRNAGHQTAKWRGVGVPVEVDSERFDRQSD